MQPVRTSRTTSTFYGNDAKALPARVEDGVAFSVWDLTPAERMAVAEGARIELGVRMDHLETIPAVSLAVDTEPREI